MYNEHKNRYRVPNIKSISDIGYIEAIMSGQIKLGILYMTLSRRDL